jgi:hypothetical protein
VFTTADLLPQVEPLLGAELEEGGLGSTFSARTRVYARESGQAQGFRRGLLVAEPASSLRPRREGSNAGANGWSPGARLERIPEGLLTYCVIRPDNPWDRGAGDSSRAAR